MVVRELMTRIGFDVDTRPLGSITESLSRAGNILSGLQAGLQMMSGAVSMMGSALGSMLGPAMQIEKLQTDFGVLLGDMEKGKQLMTDINKMAAQTPFETSDLASGAQRLLAFGSSQEKVLDQMAMLGDIALGDAEKLDGLGLAFGQVMAKGKLATEEANQMTERGFNPFKYIAENMKLTESAVREMATKGQLSFKDLENAMKTATSAGHSFYQGMAMGAKTTAGVISTLKDSVTMALASLGTAMLDPLKVLAGGITGIIGGPIMKFFEGTLAPMIQRAFVVALPYLDKLGASLNAFFASAGPASTIFQTMFNALGPMFSSFMTMMSAVWPMVQAWIPMMVQLFGLIWDLLPALMKVMTLIYNVVAPIYTMFADIMTGVIKFVRVLLAKLIPTLDYVAGIAYSVGLAFRDLWNQIKAVFALFSSESALSGVMAWVDGILIAIKTIAFVIGGLAKLLISAWSYVFTTLADWINEAVQLWIKLKDAVMSSFMGPVIRGLQSMFKSIVDYIATKVNKLVTWANSVLPANAQIALMGGSGGEGGMFSDLWNKLQEQMKASSQKITPNGPKTTTLNTDVNVNVPAGTSAKDAKKIGKEVSQAVNSAFSIQLQNVLLTTI